MRLVQLKPQFYRYEERLEDIDKVDPAFAWNGKAYVNAAGQTWAEAGYPKVTVNGPREYLVPVASLPEAHGIMFLCPLCFQNNGGGEGTHHVHMPFANRGVDPAKHQHQWNAEGTGIEDLTTTPSYLIIGGCGWHGYLTNGEATII